MSRGSLLFLLCYLLLLFYSSPNITGGEEANRFIVFPILRYIFLLVQSKTNLWTGTVWGFGERRIQSC